MTDASIDFIFIDDEIDFIFIVECQLILGLQISVVCLLPPRESNAH